MAKNQQVTKILREIRYRENLNQTQIADKIGVASNYLSDVKNERCPLTEELLERLYVHFPYLESLENVQSDVSVAPKTEDGALLSTNPHGIKYYKVGDKLMAKVPLMRFSAFGSAPDDWGALTADRDDVETIMVEVDRVSRGNYVVFSVDNDSMDDGSRRSFEPGDQIFVRELDRSDWLPRLRFDRWPFWVIAFGNNIRLKQITAQDEQGNITCHSLNPSPEFTDFTLPLDSISHLYNVIRKIPKTIDYERP